MDVTTNTPTSQLFACIMEFFSLVIRQETWPLNYGPATPAQEVDDGHGCDSPPDVDMDSTPPTYDEMEYTSRSWQMTRFLLNEERERLCLWKFDFTDDDLDRLTASPGNIFGGAVIRSLSSIGQALIKGVVEELNSNRKRLAFLVSEGNGLLRRPYYDDDAAETIASTGYEGSMSTDVTVPDEKPEELLETLKSDIGRLQRLSFSISQTLAGMADVVRL
ncbi:hypothetical protein CMUS01_16085 [Colletotrichum musicola]|uniref:Uncharacterized protein n=1 Tax=Colletotrichum musicola TaxID=2175873 RepID=A0A8H6MKK5_9PEZI|nr:hypothetical protein CMUS01_16085 [Colletotrichum musicola]